MVLSYCPRNVFMFFAGVRKRSKRAWLARGAEKKTNVFLAVVSSSRMKWVLDNKWGNDVKTFVRVADKVGGVICLRRRESRRSTKSYRSCRKAGGEQSDSRGRNSRASFLR